MTSVTSVDIVIHALYIVVFTANGIFLMRWVTQRRVSLETDPTGGNGGQANRATLRVP
jgi:hypothetical protein